MKRAFFAALFAIAIVAAPPAQADKAPPVPVQAISPDQARQALEVLNDPAKRAAFAATLNAIIKAQPTELANVQR